MNKLKGDCFIGHDTSISIVQILVNIQIFALVREKSSSTRPAYKREYLYIHSYNCTIMLTNYIMNALSNINTFIIHVSN